MQYSCYQWIACIYTYYTPAQGRVVPSCILRGGLCGAFRPPLFHAVERARSRIISRCLDNQLHGFFGGRFSPALGRGFRVGAVTSAPSLRDNVIYHLKCSYVCGYTSLFSFSPRQNFIKLAASSLIIIT